MSDCSLNGGSSKKDGAKSVKIDWICVNPDCTAGGKSGKGSRGSIRTASPHVVAYYGCKIDSNTKRKVCSDCLEKAESSRDRMVDMVFNRVPLIQEPLPIVREAAVILDDSDSESECESEKVDEIDNEEMMEFQMPDGCQPLDAMIQLKLDALGAEFQIEEAFKSGKKRMDDLDPDQDIIDQAFLDVEKQVDELRENLYRPFRPELEFVPPLDIKSGAAGGKQEDIVPISTVPFKDPSLPPLGPLERPSLVIGCKVFAMRGNILNVWKEGYVQEIGGETSFKIRFGTVINGKLKTNHFKNLSLKHLAYSVPAPVRLQVGTRVIGVYVDHDNPSGTKDYYSGIVAEPPKTMNRHRYLVFFDDGYASYIKHCDIRVVCKQTENAVWEDIHPNSREFIKKYLQQYPERPMVRLSVGQPVRTEWEGSWWWTRVEAVDASLVRLVFQVNNRREAVYRGSTRLGPLFSEMQQQKKMSEGHGGNKFAARRHHSLNRQNRPFVEYTRTTEDEEGFLKNLQQQEEMQPATMMKRAVARKSTAPRKPENQQNNVARVRWEYKGQVRPLDVPLAEGIKFCKHQCGQQCTDDTKFRYDEEKRVNKEERLKDFNPLLVPIILGWKRQLTKHNNYGRRSVYYVAPCGRRLRSLEEVHRYLRVTHCNLEIDFFNFEWYVHVYNFFTPERTFYKIDDISYGKENVAVSCVNSLDNNYPEYVDYSTVRLPQQNVNIPLDEGFLTCCDCTDDCQDKEKCACWQLTINSTASSNPDSKVNPNVGYVYRRLPDAVATGIYECNKFCQCKRTCLNRVSQNPLRVQLQVFKTERRGWGIRSLCDIPKGGFICIYVGNLYTNEEANRQGQDFGDEYFAELDLIEVVEGRKEGYESDYEGEVEVVSDEDFKADDEDLSGNTTEEEVAMPDRVDLAFRASLSSSDIITTTDRKMRNRSEKKATAATTADDDCIDIDPNDDDNSNISKKSSNKEGESDPNNVAAESKIKYTSTRKYFHKDEDFYVMDAKSIGNIGRYLNHSCNPNCFVQNCFVDTHDLRFPWVAFFASGHITAGEELCWDYNYQVDQVQGKEIYCQCGAENCRGRLL